MILILLKYKIEHMTTKLSITILFFLGIHTVLNAQSISGKITNNNGQAIPYRSDFYLNLD